jgi:hypothetical protein
MIGNEESILILQLTERISKLENTVQELSKVQARTPVLPNSQIFSMGFFSRSFAIWGHVFVAQALVSLVMLLVLGLISGLFSY